MARLAGPMQRWWESLGFHEAILGHEMGAKNRLVEMVQLQKKNKEKIWNWCEDMWTATTELVINDCSIVFLYLFGCFYIYTENYDMTKFGYTSDNSRSWPVSPTESQEN